MKYRVKSLFITIDDKRALLVACQLSFFSGNFDKTQHDTDYQVFKIKSKS